MLNAIFTVLFIALWTPLSGVVAQCPVTAGYLGAFDSFSGAFIGAVSRNFGGVQYLGLAALDRTGNPSNYLAVIAYTNSTSEGDTALLQILNPGDPNVPFVSLVVGILDCKTAQTTEVRGQHSLFMVQDLTHNYLAATPDPDIYASSNGGVIVEEVAEWP
ncbi:hypothetical protein B0H14DRAFT_3438966 [Mycena olivaceomarginata]|nr:hypothetical protein B0H14DRAFT_3438966 [Mycena olivaceomarginata]